MKTWVGTVGAKLGQEVTQATENGDSYSSEGNNWNHWESEGAGFIAKKDWKDEQLSNNVIILIRTKKTPWHSPCDAALVHHSQPDVQGCLAMTIWLRGVLNFSLKLPVRTSCQRCICLKPPGNGCKTSTSASSNTKRAPIIVYCHYVSAAALTRMTGCSPLKSSLRPANMIVHECTVCNKSIIITLSHISLFFCL